MDDIKDAKGDGFSRFIDAQHVRTDPFGKNRAAERLYRRVERICAALYLLTRHISESEPLRVEIRSEGIALLEKVLLLRDEMRAAESGAVSSFEASIRHLISLVRILTAAGRISFQNADTVIAALDELTGFIVSSQRSSFSEMVSLSREDLMGDSSPLRDRQTIKDLKDSRRIVKDNAPVSDSRALAVSARGQGIVSILRATGALGIKDISARLPDYSEKMIQRELSSLIKSGQVKKEGFKRWSKYSIV
ncbi:MAG TPA: hypothetical protein VG102_01280 [Candidatus Paceibacterota bacterium]|jgi:hypothetical protein|nr:hypothetical protein [Candidatus Paceibacterota bacterium]